MLVLSCSLPPSLPFCPQSVTLRRARRNVSFFDVGLDEEEIYWINNNGAVWQENGLGTAKMLEEENDNNYRRPQKPLLLLNRGIQVTLLTTMQ
jgi:hypothetical protein